MTPMPLTLGEEKALAALVDTREQLESARWHALLKLCHRG
jgi:hypothetical protein